MAAVYRAISALTLIRGTHIEHVNIFENSFFFYQQKHMSNRSHCTATLPACRPIRQDQNHYCLQTRPSTTAHRYGCWFGVRVRLIRLITMFASGGPNGAGDTQKPRPDQRNKFFVCHSRGITVNLFCLETSSIISSIQVNPVVWLGN